MRTTLMSTAVAVCGALAAVFAAPAQANRVNFAVSINVPVSHGVVIGATAYRHAPVVIQPVVVIRSGQHRHRHHHFRNDFRGHRGNGHRY